MQLSALLVVCIIVVTVWGQTTFPITIFEYLSSHRYNLFLNYIKQAGLIDILNGTGPYTLFGPPNPYFYHVEAFKNDATKLTEVMKYQIAPGLYMDANMSFNENQLDSLQGSKIRINHYYTVEKVTAEGQTVFAKDYVMSNGVIHFITNPMVPPNGTVYEVVDRENDLTTLLSAVENASLEPFFLDQDPITLFAPTDKAFAALGTDRVQRLLNNQTLLTSVLKYHVVPGTLYAVGYHDHLTNNDQMSLHTFQEGDKLRIHRVSHGYAADSGLIGSKELSATNGVVHKVDHVLIPQSLVNQI